GGVSAVYGFDTLPATVQDIVVHTHSLPFNLAILALASGVLGMANGSVFQLLPQRFGRELGVMTGLVGAGGGIGGFYLASSLGFSKGLTGSYFDGLAVFAILCFTALLGLFQVKTRWRTTWGALANARI
ncbi:MAG TPA: hypothetical protein VN625_04655, partial [Desulfuromonadaceae bacterium]|nr:hypothetical protein [Desulfuromonadaceae bacterium]